MTKNESKIKQYVSEVKKMLYQCYGITLKNNPHIGLDDIHDDYNAGLSVIESVELLSEACNE